MLANVLRNLVNRHWLWLLLAWGGAAAGLHFISPAWDDVALDGDLVYLPSKAPSLAGDQLLRDAFPNTRTNSTAVLVFSRADKKLSVEDRQYALDTARAIESLGGVGPPPDELEASASADELWFDRLVDVWHEKTDLVSGMLASPDGKALLVIARLETGLMAIENIGIRDQLLKLIEEGPHPPEGLAVGLTGSTIIGGDVRSAVLESLEATHTTTILLVLLCLVVIYRAPLLVLVPLATIGISMSVAYDLIALLAYHFGPDSFSWSGLRVFTTTKIFVVVILFGAGTDYCLFLIARYKEVLQQGATPKEASGLALSQVGSALAGSALTTILGLATMAFAEYGKFSSSGPVIAVCLSVALLACITFAPALLRGIGPRVFWPFITRTTHAGADDRDPWLWVLVSRFVQRRPATILAVSAVLAAPLVISGVKVDVTHDLLSELPVGSVSVDGAELVKKHFGEGWVAPVTVVARLPEGDLHKEGAVWDVARLHAMLYELPEVADVRSIYLPTGGDPRRQPIWDWNRMAERAAAGSPITVGTFVSEAPGEVDGEPLYGRVTQLSVVLATDPFAEEARSIIPTLEAKLAEFGAAETIRGGKPNPWFGADFRLAGVTPGMRDLEEVTNRDRVRIQVLTVAAVFGVLLVILRRPAVCVYLLLTVLLSYWATIGVTEAFFGWLYGDSYGGLDWKAPIFLFVILIAVGQDYNIYLTTRVLEEQAQLGRRRGLHRAVVQTGGIITSCGVIMAGTFVSMATGTLRGMVELGFALALGVLLDTFFVRTIVVPCYFAIEARLRGSRSPEPTAEAPPQQESAMPSPLPSPSPAAK
ncbi:MAG: MMPL family transporter [Planctomycetota bacterium]